MSEKQGMNRRLKWVLGVTAVVIVLVAAGFVIRMQQVRSEVLTHRAEGIEALEAGDHERAVGLLASYLSHHEDDAEALYYFAQARREVEQPQQQHLSAAANALQRAVRLDPDHLDAGRELASLYLDGGFYQEAIEATDTVLDREPDDWEALRIKALSLRQLDRPDDAISVAQRAAEQRPGLLEWHLTLMNLYQEAGRTDAAVAYARDWHASHPDDPRAMLIRAAAHQMADQPQEARDWLERAAQHDTQDPAFVQELVQQFDAVGEHQRAAEIVEGAAEAGLGPDVSRLYAMRLWQRGRAHQLLDYLEQRSNAGEPLDTELTAIRTLAWLTVGERGRARTQVEVMARRQDAPSQAWAAMLDLMVNRTAPDPSLMVSRALELVRRAPQSADAHHLLGRAYAAMDEPYQAIDAWAIAADLAPAWPEPLIQAADLLRTRGRADDAVRYAREAQRRSPGRLDAAVTFVLTLAESQDAASRERELLEAVEQIQEAVEFEPQTFPLYVSLLHRTGREARSREVIQALLASDQPLNESAWLRLAQVSEAVAPEAVTELFDRSEAHHGPTPRLARARATHRLATDSPEASLKAFDQTMAAADAASTRALEWQFARAQHLEAIGAPEAAEAWTALAERHPEHIAVQAAAVRAPSVRDERTFRHQAIERLQQLTGEQATTWRLERARWLVDGEDVPQQNLAEASLLLNDLIDRSPSHLEARLLMAYCLQQLDNPEGALDHLHFAVRQQPHNPQARLQLATLLQTRGDFAGAREHLDQLAQQGSLQPQHERHVAALIERQEQGMDARTQISPELMEAHRDWQQGDLAGAQARIEHLLETDGDAPPPMPVLALAVEFFAAQGDLERAGQMLDRMDQHDLPAGTRELLHADFHSRFGDAAQAEAYYEQATERAPANARVWRERVSRAFAHGEAEQAVELARQAHQNLPEDPTWSFLLEHEAVLRVAGDMPQLRPLLVAMVHDPRHQAAAAQAATLVVNVHTRQEPPESLLPRLHSLSEEHPQFLALQMMVATILHLNGDHADAARVARRTMDRFPAAGEPAALAARALQAAGEWDALIEVAGQWKQRVPRSAADADALVAYAHLRTGEPARALDQLQPHVENLREDPEAHQEPLTIYVHALMAAERIDEADALVRPWLDDSPHWRQLWRRLAGQGLPDPELAADWLERVEQATPADAYAEHLDLVQQWRLLGQRFNRPAYQDVADDHLDRLAAHEDAPGSVHFQHGVAAHQVGDLEAAEARYRRALAVDDEEAMAANNLAVILAQQQRSLDEALALARQLVEAQPQVSSFFDTLAFVATNAGRHEEALDAIRRLRERDPDSLPWQLTHAWVLVEAGEHEKARQIFALTDGRLPADEQLPAVTREQLARIRQALPDAASGQNSERLP